MTSPRFDADPRVERLATKILWSAVGWFPDSHADDLLRNLIRASRNEPLPVPATPPVAEPRDLTALERKELERLFKAWERTTRADPYDPDAARAAWHTYAAYACTLGITPPPFPYQT